MRILITGAQGQLGQALQRNLSSSTHEVLLTDRRSLDMRNEKAIKAYTLDKKPELIINCAAFTAVDKAENEIQAAVEINQDAVRVLAKAATAINATLIHISTDYVYHNGLNRPLRETDTTTPKSVYARTKLAGEREAISACAKTYIIRTSWVYGLEGNNFVRTMQRLGATRESLTVVSDQIGAPTFADDLAEAVMHLVDSPKLPYGIYNFSGLGVASWYDFAHAIMQASELNCKVSPIPTEDYPTPAERPLYSVLDLEKGKQAGFALRHWRDALADFYSRDATTA